MSPARLDSPSFPLSLPPSFPPSLSFPPSSSSLFFFLFLIPSTLSGLVVAQIIKINDTVGGIIKLHSIHQTCYNNLKGLNTYLFPSLLM